MTAPEMHGIATWYRMKPHSVRRVDLDELTARTVALVLQEKGVRR
jgi:hypothetical protein